MVNDQKTIIPFGALRGAYSKLAPPFSDAVDYFLSKEYGRVSDVNLQREGCIGSIFFYHFQAQGIKALNSITEDDVTAYFIKDGKPKYHAGYRYSLSRFLKVVSEQYVECGIIREWIPHIRVTRKNIQYLTEEEAVAVKEVCTSDDSELSYQDKAVGIILLYTGLRGCDIADLKLSDIDWDREEIHIVQKKTSVPLTIPMLVIVGNAIYDYLENECKSDSQYLFVNLKGNPFRSSDVQYCVKKIFKAAGIRQNKGDRQGTHIFRHRVATKLLENSVAQPVISKTLGHTDPLSVETYLSADFKHLCECALSIEDYSINWEEFDHA